MQFNKPFAFNKIYLDNIRLSKRETECIYYLIRGMTIKRIAQTLKLSPRTVESYIKNIKNRIS